MRAPQHLNLVATVKSLSKEVLNGRNAMLVKQAREKTVPVNYVKQVSIEMLP